MANGEGAHNVPFRDDQVRARAQLKISGEETDERHSITPIRPMAKGRLKEYIKQAMAMSL